MFSAPLERFLFREKGGITPGFVSTFVTGEGGALVSTCASGYGGCWGCVMYVTPPAEFFRSLENGKLIADIFAAGISPKNMGVVSLYKTRCKAQSDCLTRRANLSGLEIGSLKLVGLFLRFLIDFLRERHRRPRVADSLFTAAIRVCVEYQSIQSKQNCCCRPHLGWRERERALLGSAETTAQPIGGCSSQGLPN